MNYRLVYENIISKSRLENRKKNLGIYYENHHIIPVCIGGSNHKNNLVLLTGREHFVCHWILTKIYKDNEKLAFAFYAFIYRINDKNYRKVHSKIYERAKKVKAKYMSTSKEWSEISKNACLNKIWINNEVENLRVFKEDLDKYISIGYVKGRLKFKRKSASKETRQKISKSNKGRCISNKCRNAISKFQKENPQCWISKDGKSKQIFVIEQEKYFKEGWRLGRDCNSKIDFKKSTFVKINNEYRIVDIKNLSLWLENKWEEITYEQYRQKPVKNIGKYSRYWMNNGNKNYRACKEEIEIYKTKGYIMGRLNKKGEK